MKVIIYGLNQNLIQMINYKVFEYVQPIAVIKSSTQIDLNLDISLPIIVLSELATFEFDCVVVTEDCYQDVVAKMYEYNIPIEKIVYYKNLINAVTLSKLELKYKNTECKKYVRYIQENGLDVFNASFVKKYDDCEVEAFYDDRVNMFFVNYDGKRMYMSRKYTTAEQVKNYIRGITVEQDPESPHCYFSKYFNVNNGDVVIDAGVAEGNFALSIIDKVSKIYLIECDNDWLDALKLTFAPYSDKVIFVNKFLSDKNDDEHISIDGLLKGDRVDVIKMDIEGAEIDALIGAEQTLRNNVNTRLVVCSYHCHNDEIKIRALLNYFGVQSVTSPGYMLFIWENDFHLDPEFRRGLVWSVPGNTDILSGF